MLFPAEVLGRAVEMSESKAVVFFYETTRSLLSVKTEPSVLDILSGGSGFFPSYIMQS